MLGRECWNESQDLKQGRGEKILWKEIKAVVCIVADNVGGIAMDVHRSHYTSVAPSGSLYNDFSL